MASDAASPNPALTPLVINTKSADPPSIAGGSVSVAITEKTAGFAGSRERRYLLQTTARKLLPQHRVSSCLWWLARGAEAVQVWYSSDRGRARYRNLTVCGSVWACPVCAAHIAEKRAEEVRSALTKLGEIGGSAAFATFTVAHTHEDALETVLEGFLTSFRYLTSKPSYKRLRARYGVLGFVRVLEVTYGRNGWHVHAHVLYCFSSALSPDQVAAFEEDLFPLWRSAAARSGLTMDRKHGLQVAAAYGSVEDYLAKFGRGPRWDISRELTKGHLKRGRSLAGLRHLTPWELLAAAHEGDRRCGALFRDFVDRFDGKAQLYWSPGLRSALLTDATPASDAAIVAEADVGEVLAGEIASPLWESVKRAGGRAVVLRLLEEACGSWALVADYLAAIAVQFPAFRPRDRGALADDFRAVLVQLHEEQRQRNVWRGPVPQVPSSAVGVADGAAL